MPDFEHESVKRLFRAMLTLENTEECARFFEDLCTVREIRDLAQRLDVAISLRRGKNYQEISAQTGASTATISRVNKCLLYGNGGYAGVIEKLN